MASSTIKILDNTKRVIYKFTGVGDSNARSLKIDPATLQGALNANNLLLGSGADRKSIYRLALKCVYSDVAGGAASYVELSTSGDAGANTLWTFGLGQSKTPFNEGGEPFNIMVDTSLVANTTGNIFLQPMLVGTANAYSIIVEFRKHPEDFSQGQIEAPVSFNAVR